MAAVARMAGGAAGSMIMTVGEFEPAHPQPGDLTAAS
jgi:hypothetical protein